MQRPKTSDDERSSKQHCNATGSNGNRIQINAEKLKKLLDEVLLKWTDHRPAVSTDAPFALDVPLEVSQHKSASSEIITRYEQQQQASPEEMQGVESTEFFLQDLDIDDWPISSSQK